MEHIKTKFEVFVAALIKIRVFWEITPCRVVSSQRRPRRLVVPSSSGLSSSRRVLDCFILQKKTLRSPDKRAIIYQSARR